MTKKEWLGVRAGTKVKTETWTIDRETGNAIDVTYKGEVLRMNFGCSQALVKFTGEKDAYEKWVGRLSVELDTE